jgi:hypothetical protein
MNYQRLQALLLRLIGTVELTAFGADVLPREWMDAGHAWLGFAAAPQGPVFDSVRFRLSGVCG